MRLAGVVLLVGACACSTTKVMQRDGCWVRSTKRLGNLTEEIGPCLRPQPQWSQDRLTRLTQECIAGEESRWMSRAVVAWGRGEPLPPRATDAEIMRQCVFEPTKMIDGGEAQKARAEAGQEKTRLEGEMLKARLEGEAAKARLEGEEHALQARLESQGEALKAQLAQVAADRDALRQESDADRKHIRDSADRLAGFLGDTAKTSAESLGESAKASADSLGEAAKKPSAPAVATATATSDGRANTEMTSSSTRDESSTVPAFAPAAALGLPVAACSTPLACGQAAAAPATSTAPGAPKVAARAKPPFDSGAAPQPLRSGRTGGCEVASDAPATKPFAAQHAAAAAAPSPAPAPPAER